MRKRLDNSYMAPTGYEFPDGDQVRVGDRLEVKGVESPGTVRVRMNGRKVYFYVTYSDKGVTKTRSLPQMETDGFKRWVEPASVGEPSADEEKTELGPGFYIIGLEDYDTAIYKQVQ